MQNGHFCPKKSPRRPPTFGFDPPRGRCGPWPCARLLPFSAFFAKCIGLFKFLDFPNDGGLAYGGRGCAPPFGSGLGFGRLRLPRQKGSRRPPPLRSGARAGGGRLRRPWGFAPDPCSVLRFTVWGRDGFSKRSALGAFFQIRHRNKTLLRKLLPFPRKRERA